MKTIVLSFLISSVSLGWTLVGNNVRGWKNNTVTFYVSSSGCNISDTTFNAIVDAALTSWNGVTDSSLVVRRETTSATVAEFLAGTVSNMPVILCDTHFSNEIGVNGVDVIPAATFNTQSDSDGNLISSGILLNAEPGAGANIASLSQGQVELTLAHEMGHALGLGHSNQSEALMFYSLGSKEQPLLTEDDIDGIVHLYPRNELTGGVMGCSSVHSSHQSAPSGILGLAAPILMLLGMVIIGRKSVSNAH